MHAEAHDFLERAVSMLSFFVEGYSRPCRVLELGSRDVNGTPRDLFTPADFYLGIDLRPGPGVDVVDDAASWRWSGQEDFDLVLCAEVLEHAPFIASILETAYDSLKPEGVLLVTCAGPARAPHGVDGGPVQFGEWYRPVSEQDVRRCLRDWTVVLTWDRDGQDTYALAVK